MPKRHLTPAQSFDLRQALHVATLDALMASRRWEPGDLPSWLLSAGLTSSVRFA
jgi:hypothetical protein